MEDPKGFALIDETGVATNIISLLPSNSSDFPGAVCVDDQPVAIGDVYMEDEFWRGNEPVKSLLIIKETES